MGCWFDAYYKTSSPQENELIFVPVWLLCGAPAQMHAQYSALMFIHWLAWDGSHLEPKIRVQNKDYTHASAECYAIVAMAGLA